MTQLTRKQREIARREQLILDTARALFNEGGLSNINMDRIAAQIEYSKGTIYQHFESKEDLIGALAVETVEIRAGLFARAGTFRGSTRERMTALGLADEIFVRVFPHHLRSEQLLETGMVIDKASEVRREAITRINTGIMDGMLGVIDEAVVCADLKLPPETPPCQIMYGLWAMVGGHHLMDVSPFTPPHFSQISTNDCHWANCQLLLDAYGWKPLSGEHDYSVTMERIRRDIFPDETEPLKSENTPGREVR